MIEKLDEKYIDDIVSMRFEMQKEEKYVNLDELTKNEGFIKENTKKFVTTHLNKDLFVFGYIIDNKVVSMSSLLLHSYYPSFDNIKGIKGRLSAVYTLKDHRHNGYQKKTLLKLIEQAEKMEVSSIKVNCNNPAAIKLYERFGFNFIFERLTDLSISDLF